MLVATLAASVLLLVGAVEVDVSSEGIAALMDDELYTLEMSIASQQQKLEMLRALRQSQLDPLANHARKKEYCEDLAKAIERLGCRDDDAVVVAGDIEEEAVRERAILAAEDATALEMLSFRARGVGPQSFVHVVAIGYANGTVGFFDTSGESVASLSETAASVSAFGFDGRDSLEPSLAVGRADGTVSLFNMSLLRNDLLIAGRRPHRQEDDRSSKHTSSLSDLRLFAKPQGQVMRVGGDTSSTVALDVLLARRTSSSETERQQQKLVVAAVGSSLKLYHPNNGTESRSFDFANTISSIERSGNIFAVAHGPSVSLFSASKWTVLQQCPDGPATVSALAFDTSSYLHAAYSSGDMLVFTTRGGGGRSTASQREHKGIKDRQASSSSCKLHHKLPKSAHGSNGVVGLASSRGFLISVDDTGSIAVHNTTFLSRRAPRHVYSTAAAAKEEISSEATEATPSKKRVLFAGSHLLLRVSSTTEVVFGCLAKDRLVLYESLFRYDPQQRDIGWMRMPIILVGVVVVFLYQVLRQRKPPRSSSSYYGGGMDADTAAFMRDFATSSGVGGRRGRSRLHDD